MTPELIPSLSPNSCIVGGEGWGEGDTPRTSATSINSVALPPHPTLSPRRAWGRGPKCAALKFLLLSAVLLITIAERCDAQTAPSAPSPTEQPGANLEVALITFGPGEEIWERFGHNAIEIRDRSSGQAHWYNYGIFDFAQQNFFLNFARGLMTYRIAQGYPSEELPVYVEEGRWVIEQQLNLTPPQRMQLAEFLAWNARPDNAQYLYDYFTANCSTRVRDALDAAVGGAIKAQTIAPSRGFTFRMDADRLMRPDPAVMLAMDAGLGPYADRRLSFWDESFVPMEFMRHMREIHVPDETGKLRPLVARETQLAAARLADPPAFAPDWTWRALAVGCMSGLLLLGLAYLRARAWARLPLALVSGAVALTLGIGGLVLLGLWTLTDHVSAWRNENLLLFNPLCLLLLPCWLGALRARWRPSRFAWRVAMAIAFCAALAFFVKIFPAFAQDNRFWIALLLPLHVAFALILTRVRSRTLA
jgi:hypothetical protein